MWTVVFLLFLLQNSSIWSLEVTIFPNGETSSYYAKFLFYFNECDKQGSPTPLMQFLSTLLPQQNWENGNFFSSTGRPLLECNDIEPSVFFVPDTHSFMWPTFELGHRVSLEDITVPGVEDSVSLVTVSHSPRIFLVENLISSAESDRLIEYMSTKSSEEDGLDVSLIGDGVISLQRTSSNGWDSESTIAIELKGRCLELLRVPQADETWLEKIQIARYLPSQFYDLHFDFFHGNPLQLDADLNWNIDGGNGTNRFATLLFYLSDVLLGGETIFPEASMWWNESTQSVVSGGRSPKLDASSNPSSERDLNSLCHRPTKYLSISPKRLNAILFYSQSPSRELDVLSRHGACPVLQGTKWIATVWMWNGQKISSSHLTKAKLSTPHSVVASVVVMFSLSLELQQITAPIRLLDPLQEVVGVFQQNGKPIVVNSEVGKIWTIEVVLDREATERLTLSQVQIQHPVNSEKIQRYVVSVEE